MVNQVRQGVPLTEVQQQFEHVRIDSTSVYANPGCAPWRIGSPGEARLVRRVGYYAASLSISNRSSRSRRKIPQGSVAVHNGECPQYRAELVEATSHDLREYRTRLAERQKPASVNAALAALQRFYGWARDAGLVKTNPTAKLKPVASQPLAPQGFTSIERQRLRREAERAGPMPDAIVTTLLNTGLRVDELIRLTWDDVTLLPRSGKAAIRKGKGDKARTVPLNTLVRDALNGVRPALVEGPIFRGRRGPYTDRGIRNLLAVLGRRANVSHVHPHRFRHDTARRLVEHVDLPTVAALLGHSRLDTVRMYAQPDLQALERAAATLERSDASSP